MLPGMGNMFRSVVVGQLLLLTAVLFGSGCAGNLNVSSSGVQAARPAPSRIANPAAPSLQAWPSSAPSIYADSAILIDARTGETLYEKNADERRPVASTQKLVTALLVAENRSLDEKITVLKSDTSVEPSKLYLKAGHSYPRRELLTAMMVKSSNDAAEVLGRDYSGSRYAFANEMTKYAHRLGATNSFFTNPHGLPDPQYSTARDMARVAHRAYRNPVLRGMMDRERFTFVHNDGRTTKLKATNKLLDRSDIFNGMKTGYTNASGRCFIASASYNGRELIFVQLGSKTKYIFDDAERIIRWQLSRGPFPTLFASAN